MKKLLPVLILTLAATAWAEDFGSDFTAAMKNDYATSLVKIKDYAGAAEWYRLAAEEGVVSAQLNLGVMYDNGKGVPEDDAEAVKWYTLAAEQGNAAAQLNLGIKYAKGQGVAQDDVEAVKWYKLAAEQGETAAQYNLGVRYATGKGVEKDYQRAHMWWSLVTVGGKYRSLSMKNRAKIAAKMTHEQIEQAREMARECHLSKYKNC